LDRPSWVGPEKINEINVRSNLSNLSNLFASRTRAIGLGEGQKNRPVPLSPDETGDGGNPARAE